MSATPARTRLPALDLLRYAAVVAVVFDHATDRWLVPGNPGFGPAALNGLVQWDVAVLLMISGYLAGSSLSAGRAADLPRRLRRILVPYLAWAFVYQALLAARAWQAGDPIHLAKPFDYLFGGPVYHVLWYLPMLAYCTIVGSFARTRRTRFLVIAVASAVRILSVVVFAERAAPAYWLTVEGFLFAMPWFIAVYVVAESWGAGDFGSWPVRLAPAIYAAAIVSWLAVGFLYPSILRDSEVHVRALQRGASGVVAAGALLLALQVKSRRPILPTSVTSISLGLYVTHMLLVVPISSALIAAGISVYAGAVITTAVAAVACTVGCVLVARVPLLRPLVT